MKISGADIYKLWRVADVPGSNTGVARRQAAIVLSAFAIGGAGGLVRVNDAIVQRAIGMDVEAVEAVTATTRVSRKIGRHRAIEQRRRLLRLRMHSIR